MNQEGGRSGEGLNSFQRFLRRLLRGSTWLPGLDGDPPGGPVSGRGDGENRSNGDQISAREEASPPTAEDQAEEIAAFKDGLSRLQEMLRGAQVEFSRPLFPSGSGRGKPADAPSKATPSSRPGVTPAGPGEDDGGSPAPGAFQSPQDPSDGPWSHYPVDPSLQLNLARIREDLGNSADLVVRELVIGAAAPLQAALLYVEGLADRVTIQEYILRPLVETRRAVGESLPEALADLRSLPALKQIFPHSDLKPVPSLREAEAAILRGDAAFFLDGLPTAVNFAAKGWKARVVEEPLTESVIRGPREGFTEVLRTNTSLIRRRLGTPGLRMEEHELGRVSRTKITLCYIEGIARPEIVAEVRRRLQRIQVDSILETGYLEELIEDQPLSPFPQIAKSERPDAVAGNLLEGRVAILVEGTPVAMLVPAVFWQFLQASEDYYNRSLISTFLRWIRYISVIFAIALPAFYIAATTYHQEIIPFSLLLSLSAARASVPIPVLLETLLMELTFEALREGGVRLPRPIGPAVTIVGALILGDAAVSAGLISPMVVIVVSSTAIASFTIPGFDLSIALRLLRLVLMFMAAFLGFFGLYYGLLFVLIHLASLRSFGIPYMAPLFSARDQNLRDVLRRAPWWSQYERPGTFTTGGKRVAEGLKPAPPGPRDPDAAREPAGQEGRSRVDGGGSGA